MEREFIIMLTVTSSMENGKKIRKMGKEFIHMHVFLLFSAFLVINSLVSEERYEGEWVKGEKHGIGVYYYAYGDKYQGE